jgi:hypothetical protein
VFYFVSKPGGKQNSFGWQNNASPLIATLPLISTDTY